MSCIPHYAAGRRNPRADQKTKMSVFDTSKIRRHNTQLAVAEATKAAEDDAVDLGVPRCCGAFTPSTRLVSISQ